MKTYLSFLLGLCGICFGNQTVYGGNFLNADSIVNYYVDKAYTHLSTYKTDSAKFYLDSASVYKEKVTNVATLGDYYYYSGIYNSFKQNEIKAHQNYYKAIDYYEKTGKTKPLSSIYHNLASSYIQKKDTDALRKIIHKMKQLALKRKQDVAEQINTYGILSFYYDCMYEKNNKLIHYLDSAIYYDKQVISLYEANPNLPIRTEEIAYNYLHLASSLLKKGEFNVDMLSSYLEKADELRSENDNAMLINRLWVDASIKFIKKDYNGAKQALEEQLTLMEAWLPQKDLSIYLDVYDRLTEIAHIQSDYAQASAFQQKKMECLTQIHDIQRYEVIRELETKYEVKQKEQEIVYLKQSKEYQQKIKHLYLSLFLLAVVALLFMTHWLKQKRKAALIQLELTRIEKERALLEIQQKEKELNEKNKTLNNTISEKCVALHEVNNKKEEVSALTQKLEKYRKEEEKQKSKEVIFATENPYYTIQVKEVYTLINKRITDLEEKNEYLNKLTEVDDHFFLTLENKAQQKLTPLEIQRCVCFYIGINTTQVAKCYSKEIKSIQVAYTRIKKKFSPEYKDTDFDTFLKLIVN